MRDLVLRGLLRVIGWLSFANAGRIGAAGGWIAYRFGGRPLRTVRVNLALCFPDMDEAERERMARENLVETGRILVQMLNVWLRGDHDWRSEIDDDGMVETGRRLLARGHGLIIALPHFGNWELIAYIVTRIGPTTAMYRPPRQAVLDPVMRAGRARSGITPVPIDRNGLKEMHAALKRGEIIVILPDQVPKSRGAAGVVAPFFEQPALTMTLIGRLAQRHASPVLFCYALPDATSGRLQARCFEGEEAIADPAPETAAAALNRGVERCVRLAPAQYQWTYRRFEIPGADGRNPYKAGARR